MSAALEKLQAAKAQYHAFNFLDFSSLNFVDAHCALGEIVAGPARHTLALRLDHLTPDQLALKVRQARACRAVLEQRKGEPSIQPALRAAIDEYLEALAAWAEGLGLADFSHPALSARVDGLPVRVKDLAMLMQHDNTGCQTGMYRQPDGSLIFWHGEEDIHPERFDILPVAEMVCLQVEPASPTRRRKLPSPRPVHLFAFIYPDLLPGPAFAWRSDGYVQAVDLLIFRRPPQYERAALVNVVAWLAWRLGPAWDPGEIAQALLPFYDAYALNAAGRRQGQVWGGTLEYGAGQVISNPLADSPGSRSFQANVFRNRSDPALAGFEKLSRRSERFFHGRTARTLAWLERKPVPGEPQPALNYFLHLLRSRHGGGGSYANPDVRAYFLARLAPDDALGPSMEIWLGPGPALAGETPIVLKY